MYFLFVVIAYCMFITIMATAALILLGGTIVIGFILMVLIAVIITIISGIKNKKKLQNTKTPQAQFSNRR